MTRADLLRILVRQAKKNGFEFRKWYIGRLTLPWTSFEDAIATLARERRYYSLLFDHEFVEAFWKQGSKITFVVPNVSYTRMTKKGKVITVHRRGHTRRSAAAGVWRYHLQQMAIAEDPLRYIRRFLLIEEDIKGTSILEEPESPDEVAMQLSPDDDSEMDNDGDTPLIQS